MANLKASVSNLVRNKRSNIRRIRAMVKSSLNMLNALLVFLSQWNVPVFFFFTIPINMSVKGHITFEKRNINLR
jgi:hypothetical protein